MGKDIIHKEYLQEDVTVDNLYGEYKNMDRQKFLKDSLILREYLKFGSSENVAKIIQN